YRNARFRNGVTAVNSHDFGNGRANNFMHLSGDQLRQASLVRGQVPIAPTDRSLRVSDRAVSQAVRRNDTNTRFFSHSTAPQVNRVPFAEQRRSLEQVSRPGGS